MGDPTDTRAWPAHAYSEPGITAALVAATDRFATAG